MPRLSAPSHTSMMSDGAGGPRAAASGNHGPCPQRRARPRPAPRWLKPLRRAVAGVLTLGVLGGAGFWVWHSGVVSSLHDGFQGTLVGIAAKAGYVVADVLVEGRNRTNQDALRDALGIKAGDPILAFDLADARDRVEQLPWVASATIERRLPDTVVVRLTEHQAMAIWQNRGRHVVIGRDGKTLSEQGAGSFPELPIVVGEDAPAHAGTLLTLLAGEPTVQTRLEAAVRIGGRRWDLRLNNGVTVRLPETDLSGALHLLAEMQEKGQLFDRDIVAVDLRLPDRLVVQTVAREPEKEEKKKGADRRT